MAATVRLATRVDVPLINVMVHELAEVEGNEADCKATDAKLDGLLLRQAPFQGPTVLMLEIEEPPKGGEADAMAGTVVTKTAVQAAPVKTGSDAGVVVETSTASVELMLFRSVSNVQYKERFFSEVSSPKKASSADFLNEVSSSSLLQASLETDMEEPVLEVFRSDSDVNLKERAASVTETACEAPIQQDAFCEEIVGEFPSWNLVQDSESETFRVPSADGKGSRLVVGYVHVYPNFSTYLSKAGLQMEAFYIRKPYRHLGLGKMFLRKVAREAVKRGMERIEWAVMYSNDPAIKFYEGMGAVIKPGFRKCGIDGQGLDSCEP